MRDFFAKNPIVKAFFKGFDRKDEKIVLNYFKTSEVEMGERLIRKDTKDRCIIIVVAGKFIQFGNNSERDIEYKEGAVIGVDEFLKNNEWTRDIICEQEGVICKFTEESMLDMIQTQPMTAIKMLRRIVRHQCYDYIYQHKLEQRENFEYFLVQDEDLFIDMKLNYRVPEEKEWQERINDRHVSDATKAKKGREFESLPFFLADEFKKLAGDRIQGLGGPHD